MRILVLSDSHGRNSNMWEVIERVDADMLFHLGDSEDETEAIKERAGCPCEFVKGNCDYDRDLPDETVVDIGCHRAFLTHGHRYSVRFDLNILADAAKEHGCDIAMFGHTHIPENVRVGGVDIYNPGSISLPRQDGRIPTFMVIDVDGKGEWHVTLNELKKR